MARIVSKPWGKEFIWIETEFYVSKILYINPGEALSLQYHTIKDESLLLLSGEAYIVLQTFDWTSKPTGDYGHYPLSSTIPYRIPPGTHHRLYVPDGYTPASILEVSTPETGETIRLEDKYGR